MHGCESWTEKKTDRKEKRIHLKYGVGRELYEYPELPENEQMGS